MAHYWPLLLVFVRSSSSHYEQVPILAKTYISFIILNWLIHSSLFSVTTPYRFHSLTGMTKVIAFRFMLLRGLKFSFMSRNTDCTVFYNSNHSQSGVLISETLFDFTSFHTSCSFACWQLVGFALAVFHLVIESVTL